MKPDGREVPIPRHVSEIKPSDLPSKTLRMIVFGPGRGEAIVVQLPDESVGVVDGCAEPQDMNGYGDPVRHYLQHLDASATSRFRLRFICLTHPHDDHYGGMGRLLEAYADRLEELWMVDVYQPRYAEALQKWFELHLDGKYDGDWRGLERVLQQRHKMLGERRVDPKNVIADMSLLTDCIEGYPVTAVACGPATHDLLSVQDAFMENIERRKRGQSNTAAPDPNQTSGALVISWGESRILLAGDLLRGRDVLSGWQRAEQIIRHPIQVVNVAHHGSEPAHHDALWDRMQPKLAILTPFRRAAGSQPPRPADIRRLGRSSVTVITSPPDWIDQPGSPVPDRSVGRRRLRRPGAGRLSRTIPAPGFRDIRNAAAVAMDPDGRLVDVVLAGDAAYYD